MGILYEFVGDIGIEDNGFVVLPRQPYGTCEGCIEGHIQKALKYGASKEEISEAIVIAVGINAASIVDMTDKAATNLDLDHFPAKQSRGI